MFWLQYIIYFIVLQATQGLEVNNMVNYVKFIDTEGIEHKYVIPETIAASVRFAVNSDAQSGSVSYALVHDIREGDQEPNFLLSLSQQTKNLNCKTLKVQIDTLELSYDIEDFNRLYMMTPHNERAGDISDIIMVEFFRMVSGQRG